MPLSGHQDVDRAVEAAHSSWRRHLCDADPATRLRHARAALAVFRKHAPHLAGAAAARLGLQAATIHALLERELESIGESISNCAPLRSSGATAGQTLVVPHGVVAAVAASDSTLPAAIWQVPWALACGNAVVVKPSPGDAAGLEPIWRDLDTALPGGLVNVVNGTHDVIIGLLENPRVPVMSHAGRALENRGVRELAARSNTLIATASETQPLTIVAPDARLDRAAADLARECFARGGRAGSATHAVIVPRDQYPAFVTELTAAVQALHTVVRVGGRGAARVHELVAQVEAAGDSLAIVDGRSADGRSAGPTILGPAGGRPGSASGAAGIPVLTIACWQGGDLGLDLATSLPVSTYAEPLAVSVYGAPDEALLRALARDPRTAHVALNAPPACLFAGLGRAEPVLIGHATGGMRVAATMARLVQLDA